MKNKYFKKNDEYFSFLNKMKNKIEVIQVEIKKKIKLTYQKV